MGPRSSSSTTPRRALRRAARASAEDPPRHRQRPGRRGHDGCAERPAHVVEVHDYATLISVSRPSMPGRRISTRTARRRCDTSGTTGNPKGVSYSHRSNYLHALTAAMTLGFARTTGCSSSCRSSTPTPGVSRIWRWLRSDPGHARSLPPGGPLAQMIETEKVSAGAGVRPCGTTCSGTSRLPVRMSRPAVASWSGFRRPPAMMRAFQEHHGITIVHAWGMTEMSPIGTVAIPPARCDEGSDEYWSYATAQGRLVMGVEGRLVGPTAPNCRGTARASVSRGPRPVDHGVIQPQQDRVGRRGRRDGGCSATAGCEPVTSAACPPTASSGSPTAPRTSSSPAASGSARSTWRTRSAHPRLSRPRSSACRTTGGASGHWPASCCGRGRA